jgi:hypothetical protein
MNVFTQKRAVAEKNTANKRNQQNTTAMKDANNTRNTKGKRNKAIKEPINEKGYKVCFPCYMSSCFPPLIFNVLCRRPSFFIFALTFIIQFMEYDNLIKIRSTHLLSIIYQLFTSLCIRSLYLLLLFYRCD